MKKYQFDIADSLVPDFLGSIREMNLYFVRKLEDALLDGESVRSIELCKQIVRNLEKSKEQLKELVEQPKPDEPKRVVVELPLDTQEVIKAVELAANPLPEEKPKRVRKPKVTV